jgi:dolichol-phosphate mannosyltransferase
MRVVEVSVIVPTINEAENIPLLLPRIAAALAGTSYEVLIVDDNSTDNTPAVCSELAAKFPLTLLVRTRTADGLSGAVLYGMARAHGEFFCVMDADLQHPPEKLPELLEPLKTNVADFVLGSRYVEGGATAEGWTFYRRINSGVSTLLSRPFAGEVTDPMSGFFALRKSTYLSARRLTPLGYKIGLELMCKCRVRRVKEIPILFGVRLRGESKLNLKQQFRYLEHLSRLYDFSFPRASPAIKFLIAIAASWIVGFAAYAIYPNAAIAYLPALAVTGVFHARYVRTQRQFIPRRRPWMDFLVISACEWLICAAAAAWTSSRVAHLSWLEGFLYPFAAATLVRYILRKELLQDIRGLRRDARAEELADSRPPPTTPDEHP